MLTEKIFNELEKDLCEATRIFLFGPKTDGRYAGSRLFLAGNIKLERNLSRLRIKLRKSNTPTFRNLETEVGRINIEFANTEKEDVYWIWEDGELVRHVRITNITQKAS